MHGTMSQKSDTFTRIWQFALETGAADWFARALAFISGRAAADAIRQVGDGRLQAASGWSPARLCLMPSQGELEVEGFFNTSSTSPQGMPRP